MFKLVELNYFAGDEQSAFSAGFELALIKDFQVFDGPNLLNFSIIYLRAF